MTHWHHSCTYTRPKTPSEDRKCTICEVVEDENHALFKCKGHRLIRKRYSKMLSVHDNVNKIFNPETIESATEIGKYLLEIEDNMLELNMV